MKTTINAVIDWDGKQNVVRITKDNTVLIIPLGQFIELPAVRYVIELALERAGLGLTKPLPASARAMAPPRE